MKKTAWEALVDSAISAQIRAGNIRRLPDGSLILTPKGHTTTQKLKSKRESPQ